MKKINWRYTLGEIAIVIVGITIAFSLNSIKENISNKKLKKQYLENILQDIEKEIETLEGNNKKIQQKLEDISVVKPFLGNNTIRRDTILQRFFQIAVLVDFSPENTTYQTLINSGDMKLIDDFALRQNIEAHYSSHKNVLQNYTRIEEINRKYVADLFIYDVDYNKIRKGNIDFLDLPKVQNIVFSVENSYRMVLSSNKECIESNQALQEAIRKEL
jgi:hypothetical protein